MTIASDSAVPAQAAPASRSGPAAPQRVEIRAFDGPVGAEVLGLDLNQALGDEDFARIHRAHLDHHVLVFRDQRITPEQQIAFSRRFGPLQIHVLHQFQLSGYPEVLVVSNIVENGKPIGLGDAGHFWHSDLSYKEKPSLGSLLHAQELPAEGGDTLFANMHLAWDTLPAHLREAVKGRFAEHTYLAKYAELQKRSPWRPDLSAEQIAQVKPVVQPMVRTHPETGRKALYIGGHVQRFDSMTDEESIPLIDFFMKHSIRPEFTCRVRWANGTLTIWDNRCTQHFAINDYPAETRIMRRITICGDTPY